jgi:hypothetical protein
VSAAVFDAVNAIGRRYEPYAVRVEVDPDASVEAAVTAAAHHVLVALYPAQTSVLDAARDSALALVPPGRGRDDGITAGKTIGARILVMRTADNAAQVLPLTPHVGLGAWVPTPPAFATALEAAWGRVTPFVMDSGSQFRPGAPPSPGSDVYVRDYLEVVRLGASQSSSRTSSQTEAARFWVTTATQLWNQLARGLVTTGDEDPTSAARAFLLLNAAGADAMIAAWEAKYEYRQWRPVTAIRSLDDGNATTKVDSAWTPLIVTPPFPDYPAGHTAYGGAAERVLSALFGANPGELSITSATAGGITHRYRSFHEIAEEVVNARVWGGVHWRTSSTVGRELGRKIGDLVIARAPKRLP